jgi:hypothetical protein
MRYRVWDIEDNKERIVSLCLETLNVGDIKVVTIGGEYGSRYERVHHLKVLEVLGSEDFVRVTLDIDKKYADVLSLTFMGTGAADTPGKVETVVSAKAVALEDGTHISVYGNGVIRQSK